MRGHTDLINGPIGPTLRRFAIPMGFSFIVQMLYSWIDTYFVSRLGESAIAAIGFSEQIAFVIFTFGSGFAMGTGILVARRIGEGDRAAANHTATQAIVFMIAFSVALATIIWFSLPYLLSAMHLAPDVSYLAELYLSALLLGVPGNFITFQINAIVRSTGNSVYPMSILLMTTIVNALLAPLLIFGLGPIPALGMTGAGLATATAQLSGAIVSISMLMRGKTGIQLTHITPKIDFSIVWRIFRQGFPASVQMFAVSMSRIALFNLAGTFGTTVVAAYTLGLKVDLFSFMSVFAMGIALETATGQNLGAKKVERVFEFHRSAIKQLLVIMFGIGTAAYGFSEHFARIFTHDENIIAATVEYLHIAVFGYLFFAVGVLSARVISGAGAALTSMFIIGGSLLLLQLPIAYLLSQMLNFGRMGIWWGVVIGYMIFCAIALFVVYRKRWTTVRL